MENISFNFCFTIAYYNLVYNSFLYLYFFLATWVLFPNSILIKFYLCTEWERVARAREDTCSYTNFIVTNLPQFNWLKIYEWEINSSNCLKLIIWCENFRVEMIFVHSQIWHLSRRSQIKFSKFKMKKKITSKNFIESYIKFDSSLGTKDM
jgi:hypothetical protein